MVDLTKMTKEQYAEYMISLIDMNKVKETWTEFEKKYKKTHKKSPDFWIDYMELDDADLSDIEILSGIDKNFEEFVFNKPRILNDEVVEKIDKKLNGKIPDHIQIDVEGPTGVGKSTFMLAFCQFFFPNFTAEDVFYLRQNLLEYVSSNPQSSMKSIKVLDEDVRSKGVGSTRIEDDLTQLFESCRKAQLSYCGCHAVAKHDNQTVYYRFFVFCKNLERRVTCASVWRMNTCIGLIVWRIPYTKKFFELEYDYTVKKDAFILATMKNENKENMDLETCANKVMNDKEYHILEVTGKMTKKIIKMKVYEYFNNYTKEEQELITSKIYIMSLEKEVKKREESLQVPPE